MSVQPTVPNWPSRPPSDPWLTGEHGSRSAVFDRASEPWEQTIRHWMEQTVLTHDPALLSPVGFDGHRQHALDVVVQIGVQCPSGLVRGPVDPNGVFIGSNH